MALSEFMGPLCVTTSGGCCLLTMTSRGIECPPSCWDIIGQVSLSVDILQTIYSLYLGLYQPASLKLHCNQRIFFMKTLFCDFLNIHIFVMSSFLKFLNFRYKEISRRMRILLPVLAATILISGILTGELLLNVMNLEKKRINQFQLRILGLIALQLRGRKETR